MKDTIELAKGLLEYAKEDLESAGILYKENKLRSAMYHLEQASEKILKANLLAYFVLLRLMFKVTEMGYSPARFPARFKKIRQHIEQGVKNYSNPRNLGHDFDKFLNKFLPGQYELICGEEFKQFVESSINIKNRLIGDLKNKQNKIISKLQQEEYSNELLVEIFNATVELLSSYFLIFLDEDVRKRICGFKKKIKPGKALKEILKSNELCLESTVDFFNYTNKAIDKAYLKIESEKKESIEKITRWIYELSNTYGISELKKFAEEMDQFVYGITKGVLTPYMMLPLHHCLLRYYNPSRYPEGEIPEEEFASLPRVIEVLKELHKIVSDLVSRHPYIYLNRFLNLESISP